MKGKLSTLGFALIKMGFISMSLILSALLVSGCGLTIAQPNVIQGLGNVVVEARSVSDFNRVSLSGSGEVVITQGEDESLTVEADDDLMQYIKTEVKNGTLTLGFTDEARNKGVQPSEAIRFNLSVKEVVGIHIGGAGYIQAASLDTDRLEIVIGGAGDVNIGSLTAEELVVRIGGVGNAELTGQVVEQDIRIPGGGNYRAAQLESQTATVEVRGAGSVTLWATNTLDVQISGAGNVAYYGNPNVTKKIAGVGTIISRGNP